MKMSSVKVFRVKFAFPVTVTMGIASQGIFSITEWVFFKTKTL